MRTYDLMLVVRPEKEMTDQTARDLAAKMIGEEATIKEITLLGKKPLAYPIRKFTEASYVRATVTAESLKTPDVQKRANSDEELLRFLLIQKGE